MKENTCSQKVSGDKSSYPIGVFDSGVGGLTVVREMLKFLPNEAIVYLGDTARVPYGNKSKDAVLRFTREALCFFAANNVKMLLLACNTSSSLALPYLNGQVDFPIYGVIDPGVSEALKVTRSKRIGVIGTAATIGSDIYAQKLKEGDLNVEVFSLSCPLFVPLVEENWVEDPISYKACEKYLRPLKNKKIDTLILGCTHYPLMKNTIRQFMGTGVALIDSAETFVKKIKLLLMELNLENKVAPGEIDFYVTDMPDQFKSLSALFLGKEVGVIKKIDLEEYKECIKFQ